MFTVEFLLKVIGYGLYGYIKDSFNLFDGTIVIIRYLFESSYSALKVATKTSNVPTCSMTDRIVHLILGQMMLSMSLKHGFQPSEQ